MTIIQKKHSVESTEEQKLFALPIKGCRFLNTMEQGESLPIHTIHIWHSDNRTNFGTTCILIDVCTSTAFQHLPPLFPK